jgi:uncharacterized membrane protein YedE/YeeE
LERVAFLAGLLTGGVIGFGIVPGHLRSFAATYSIYRALLAGAAVGFGTGLGSGCTSGHGIGGLSRFSPRSMAAVATFMLTGAVAASLASSAAATIQASVPAHLNLGLTPCLLPQALLLFAAAWTGGARLSDAPAVTSSFF